MALYSGRRTWLWATLTGSCRMPTWACCPPAPVSGWRATQDCGSPVPARTTHTASSANAHAVRPYTHTHTQRKCFSLHFVIHLAKVLGFCISQKKLSHDLVEHLMGILPYIWLSIRCSSLKVITSL